MVGRPQLSDCISEALEADVPTIYVTCNNNSADIVCYIENSIQKSSILKRVSAKLRAQIVENLSTGAQGMFIWVELMLKELLKKRSEATIRKSLDEAPKGLKEVLRHVLESLSSSLTEDELEYLNELLAWTTCAQRPLSLGELDAILKLKSPEGEGIIYLEGAWQKQFASFFSLTREDGLLTEEVLSMNRNIVDSDDEQEENGQEGGFEDVTDFDSNPTTTEVTFCHASIGDFFRDESQGKVSAGEGYPAIGVNYNKAKMSVLKTCLQLFCDDELVKKPQGSSQSMMSYASTNWQAHLRMVDPSKMNMTERKEIVGLLTRMFGPESFMNRWVGSVTWIFFNDDNVKLVRKWLDDKEVVDSLPSEDQEFIWTTSESPAITFEPLARYIAKQWLGVQCGPQAIVVLLSIAISVSKMGLPLMRLSRVLQTAEEIISVAEWPNLDKTALWHRRLAMVLRRGMKYDEALKYFTKALELDSTMWIARGGMAIVQGLKGEYWKAIELDKVTEQELQQKLTDDPKNSASTKMFLHRIQERMAQSYKELKDKENSFECYRTAHRNSPACNSCTCRVLLKMDAKGLRRDIIDLLKVMEEEELPGNEYTRLTESFWQNQYEDQHYFRIVADNARDTNELDFLMEAYRNAIRAARKELRTVAASMLELGLARLYYQYTQEHIKAIRIWNKIIKTFARSKEESQMGSAKLRMIVCLARHSLRRALQVGIGSQEGKEQVKRTETLANTRARPTEDSSAFISSRFPSVILGLWYRLNGMEEDAKACFKPAIKEAIHILSDDDSSNDNDGYITLAAVLLAAGDDKNVIAILCALGKYKYEEGTGSAVKEEDESYAWLTCDGSCHCMLANFDNCYMCRKCFIIGFCGDCMKLLKDGAMPLDVCSQQHEWLFVPPNPEKVESGKLLIDGVFVDLEDWKNNLKQQWQV